MKRLSVIAVLLSIVIAGCGGGEQPVAEQPAAAAPEQATVESGAPAAAPTGEEAQPVMVEESAAEEEDAQPTVGGADKIEVAEIFWSGCNHCNDFEPFINRWKETIPANARFVRIPAVWNPLVELHAQLFYTEEVLANNGKLADPETFHAAVFAEYHRRGNRLASEEAIQSLFEKHGVSAEDFETTWNSFEVAQKIRVAQDLTRRYAITGVPTVVVNGKYRTGAGEAGGYPQLLELLDELIARESVR